MPIETILLKGETIEFKKKHSKLYYKGSYNKTDRKFSGTW